jgi:hypothetical protein
MHLRTADATSPSQHASTTTKQATASPGADTRKAMCYIEQPLFVGSTQFACTTGTAKQRHEMLLFCKSSRCTYARRIPHSLTALQLLQAAATAAVCASTAIMHHQTCVTGNQCSLMVSTKAQHCYLLLSTEGRGEQHVTKVTHCTATCKIAWVQQTARMCTQRAVQQAAGVVQQMGSVMQTRTFHEPNTHNHTRHSPSPASRPTATPLTHLQPPTTVITLPDTPPCQSQHPACRHMAARPVAHGPNQTLIAAPCTQPQIPGCRKPTQISLRTSACP